MFWNSNFTIAAADAYSNLRAIWKSVVVLPIPLPSSAEETASIGNLVFVISTRSFVHFCSYEVTSTATLSCQTNPSLPGHLGSYHDYASSPTPTSLSATMLFVAKSLPLVCYPIQCHVQLLCMFFCTRWGNQRNLTTHAVLKGTPPHHHHEIRLWVQTGTSSMSPHQGLMLWSS